MPGPGQIQEGKAMNMHSGGKRWAVEINAGENPENYMIDLSERKDALPCPFCGNHDNIWALTYETPVGRRWYVNHITCGAIKDQGYYQTWQQALGGWNTRSGKEQP